MSNAGAVRLIFRHEIPESLEHTVFGQAHGAGRHFQFVGNFRGRSAVNCGSPEGPPRVQFEFVLDELHGAPQQVVLAFAVRRGGVGPQKVRQFVYRLLGIRSPRRPRLFGPLPVKIDDFIPGDSPQPSSRAVPGAIAAERVNALEDGSEHVLANVRDSRFRQTCLATPLIDHRPIKVRKLPPGVGVPVLHLRQQARRRRIRGVRGHAIPFDYSVARSTLLKLRP